MASANNLQKICALGLGKRRKHGGVRLVINQPHVRAERDLIADTRGGITAVVERAVLGDPLNLSIDRSDRRSPRSLYAHGVTSPQVSQVYPSG